MKTLITFILFISPLFLFQDKLSAQVSTFNISCDYPKTTSCDIGKNGVVIIGYENDMYKHNDEIDIIRLDIAGNLVWDKKLNFDDTKYLQHYFVASADGNDFYVLSYLETWPDGGGKGIILTHFNSETGEYTQKKNDEQTFGHILIMYANKDYMFVMTSFNDHEFYNGGETGKVILYRFKKSNLEMEKLPKQQMILGTKENNVFWQPIRVTDNFVECYTVAGVEEKKISLMLARFDNDGQLISSKKSDLELVDNLPHVSSSLMPMGPGISRGNITPIVVKDNSKENTYEMSLMSWCYLIYNPESENYYAYGICGKNKQRNGITSYTGFYVAEFDKDFKELALKENSDLDLLRKNGEFNINGGLSDRSIDGYFASKNQLVIHLSAGFEDNFFYPVSIDNLTCGEGIETQIVTKLMTPGGIKYSNDIFSGSYIATPDKFLINGKTEEKLKSLHYIATSYCQYLVFCKKGKLTIYTEKMN